MYCRPFEGRHLLKILYFILVLLGVLFSSFNCSFILCRQAMGPYVFLIFVVLLALFIVFTWVKVPETKGKSIDEVTAIFKQRAYGSAGNSEWSPS